MRKIILFLIAFILSANNVFAETSALNFRLSEIKSPLNTNEFYLDFVAVDLTGNNVTVKCKKKTPSDSAPIEFNSVNLGAGGGNGKCKVDNSILSTRGEYNFEVTASNGVESKTLTLDKIFYETDGPGDLRDWNKSRNECVYKIKVRTADDDDKDTDVRTSKVEFYRSEIKNFDVNEGTRVGSFGAGADQEVVYEATAPDCGKEYYFAARAFNNSGNGSAIIGDTQTTKIYTQVTTTPGALQGAIASGTGQGSVLGQETEVKGEEGGQVAGEASESGKEADMPSDETTGAQNGILKGFNLPLIGGIVVFGIILAYAFTKKKTQE